VKLVIGTAGWRMPYGAIQKGFLSKGQIEEILEVADQNYISSIDTSPDYGDAESIIGQCFWKRDIATKIVFSDESEIYLEEKLRQSMERLRVDALDVVFIHNWDDLHQSQKTRAYKFLREMKTIGVVRDIGISTYSLIAIKTILSSKMRDMVIQFNMNILDQRVLEFESDEWRNRLLESQIRLWGRSIFLQGVLLDSSSNNPFSTHPDLKRFWEHCLSTGSNPYEVCLSFPRQLGYVDAIVVGINSKKEIHEIVRCISKPPTNVELLSFASTDPTLTDPRRWK
jgi:aryl-alcohol dehydrogenase-like predicted oxidoreductase